MTTTAQPLTLDDAAVAYARAKAAVDAHGGPFRGPDYAKLLATWRAALLDLEQAAKRAAAEKETADVSAVPADA